mgnify:CR=1 FL=1
MRIILQIAVEGEKQPVFARRIASSQGISEAYVDQILMPLRAGGLLQSRRGRKGGYQLAMPASEISVLDVVEMLEGQLSLVECVEDPAFCDRRPVCVMTKIWETASESLRSILRKITLAELKKQRRASEFRPNYVI